MLFLSLPVDDLPRARAFYEALGFRINEHSSDDRTASVVVEDAIVVTLQTRERFADVAGAQAGDPTRPTALPCLTVGSRDEVDDLLAKATSAGGRTTSSPRDEGARYTGSFADPDGNVWQLLWLDQLHVVN
ncbi:VOC family protein [Blastococcus litoris]|uniref:VOC family protein n=1 Tax=Blastococcus litoris TaxID=2171622 RepID=UPI000E3062EE|nr:VOC family protein [Blastococcus litoris]